MRTHLTKSIFFVGLFSVSHSFNIFANSTLEPQCTDFTGKWACASRMTSNGETVSLPQRNIIHIVQDDCHAISFAGLSEEIGYHKTHSSSNEDTHITFTKAMNWSEQKDQLNIFGTRLETSSQGAERQLSRSIYKIDNRHNLVIFTEKTNIHSSFTERGQDHTSRSEELATCIPMR